MILVSALIVASAASQIDMGDIQARLFYSETGRLSDDLLARKKPFIFWNTIIGEGDAEENADDILIAVTMSAGKFGAREDNERNIDSPLVLKATNEKGEIIKSRTFKNMLTGTGGSTTLAIWLDDATCAGAVTVEAKFQDQTKSAVLHLDCGE